MQYLKKILLSIVKVVAVYVFIMFTFSFFNAFYGGSIETEVIRSIGFLSIVATLTSIVFYSPLRKAIFGDGNFLKVIFNAVCVLLIYMGSLFPITRVVAYFNNGYVTDLALKICGGLNIILTYYIVKFFESKTTSEEE